MILYFYLYVAEENLHAVMIQRANKDGSFSVRPVCAYQQENLARAYVDKINAAMQSKRLPRIQPNSFIDYGFSIPQWWVQRCPNWKQTERQA